MTEEMNSYELALMIATLNKGILPWEDLKETLKSMSPDDAKVCKRKFRKLKRKMMKSLDHVKPSVRQSHAAKAVRRSIEVDAAELMSGKSKKR